MKTTFPTLRLLTALTFVAVAGPSHATDRVKANNADALNTTTSWTDGVVPTANDLAIFDLTLDGTVSSYAMGGNVTNNGISFRDAQSAQTITGSSTLRLANGSLGIAMTSVAMNNFNLGCLINLGTSGGQTFNVFDSARTLTISNVISGTGPLTKAGDGILKLSTAHTYTGGTVVSGGTLQLGSANTLPGGTVAVQSGATLDLNAFWLTNKAYVVRISGTGVANNGALVHNVSGQRSPALTNLVLDADASFGGVGRFDIGPIGTSIPSVNLGTHTLTKVRANTIFLTAPAPITNGNLVVEGGILGFSGVIMTNSSSLVTIKNGASLVFFRNASQTNSIITCPLTLEAGATVSYTGLNLAYAIDQSVGSPITLAGDATISQNSNGLGTGVGSVFELSGPISGAFGITKTGGQTLLLSGASTYSGSTLVSAGTLALSTVWKGSGPLTVNDSGSLEVRMAAPNATLNLDSLTLGNAAGPTTNTFNLSGFANPAATVISVTNALTLNGTTFVNLTGTSGLTNGTFKLITFGSIAGSGSFQMGLAPGFNATLSTNGNSLEVTVVPATLYWRGEIGGVDSGDWMTGGTTNWLDVLANARAAYGDGNGVVFNDTLTGTTNVNVPAPVVPNSVTVSNESRNYNFSGAGKISGTAGLTKTGAGTLTLGLANDYSGATMISQGTLQLGVAHALPTNTVAVTLASTLDLNGNNQTVIGLNGNGTVLNTSTTTAELRFGAGSSGTFTGVIADGGPGLLTVYKTGGGTQTLTGLNTFSGGSGNNGGTWQVGSDTALGSGPISMAFTAVLSSDSTTPHTLANSLSFTGTSVMTLGNAANNGVLTFSGPVSFTGGTRNVAFNSDVIFTGNLDNGALNKQGNGTLTMNGVATYTGNTVIQSGTLAGNGSFAGLVQIYAAATLSPGTGIGTMTLTSNLFLNVSSTTHMEVNAANSTCDRVQGLFKVTYQGTLEVTNLAGAFTNGQTFQLFSAANVAANNFAATNLPALTSGLMWNWNPSSGTLSVVPAMATTPTNISFTVSGSTLSLTWPGSHLGWLAQSNSVSVVDTNAWFDIAGSDTVTNLDFAIEPSLPNVFYRLRKP